MYGNPIGCLASICQKVGGALVASGTLSRTHLRVDTRAHERMDEGERPDGIENRHLGERVGSAGGFVAVEVGEPCRKYRYGTVSEHGHSASECDGAGWQSPEARTHRSADTLRAQLAGQIGVLATWNDFAPRELAEELQEQERVAAGRPLARGDEDRVGFRGQRLRREQRDRLLAEPARLEDCDLRDYEQLVVQLLHGTGIRRPCREHERQRYARQPPGEIDQPA